MAKKKSSKKEIDNLCTDEDEEICFVDNPVVKGEKIASFNFDCPEEDLTSINNEKADAPLMPKTKKTFKRSYMLTPEAIRKIDILKAKHPALSTYVSTIVEDAINFYYDYAMNLEK